MTIVNLRFEFSVMELAEYCKVGQQLGLKDSDLKEFIREQQDIARQARAEVRDEQRLIKEKEVEHQITLKKLEINLKEEDARIAREEAERQAAELSARRSHELELARINANNRQNSASLEVEKQRLPLYDDNEDITSYIVRFERICEMAGIPPDSRAVRLGASLRGKAAELFSSLAPEIVTDYDQLKRSLLLGFNKNVDTYRFEFRTAKRTTETYAQFVTNLRRKFSFWLAAADVEDEYESLKEFVLLDQFLSSISPDLRIHLKQHGNLSLDRAAELSDYWLAAHNFKPKPKEASSISLSNLSQASSKSSNSPSTKSRANVTCHNCGEKGHIKPECPTMVRSKSKHSNNSNSKINTVGVSFSKCIADEFMCQGTVNGFNVSTIVRDTGCGCVVVSSDVMHSVDTSHCKTEKLCDYLGRVDEFPVVKCYLKCKFFDGWVDAVVAPIKSCAVLVGNIPGVIDFKRDHGETRDINPTTAMAVTRSKATRDAIHPLNVPNPSILKVSPSEFKDLQSSCESLTNCWNKANRGEVSKLKDGSEFQFIIIDGLLYRKCISSPNKAIIGRLSLVLPTKCRQLVLNIAHECPVAGHFSHSKTYSKIATKFFWPGASNDTRMFCRSCDKCQKTSPKKVPPVSLVKMPIISEPFSRISMDIVGPVKPSSSQGHKYILTVIDWATGFPEAIPLKTTDSISVAEALLSIFSRVGVPREILSDRGTNFTSKLMGELHNLFGVKPLFSSIYHAQGNGRVERMHLTLKSCLKKLCLDKPRDWHRYLVAVLFAIRELPSNRTGFSPFELLYGRQVRGPITVLNELWTNSKVSESERDVYQYIIDLREKLEVCAKLALENTKVAQDKFTSGFDLKSKSRVLEEGDEALVLLPDTSNKLLVCWKGPFKVVKKINKVNYELDCDGSSKIYHINLLKKYHRRHDASDPSNIDHDNSMSPVLPSNVFFLSHAPVIDEPSLGIDEERDCITLTKELTIDHCNLDSPKTEPSFSNDLYAQETDEVKDLINKYSDVFSDKPGHTNTVVHKIELRCMEPVCSKVYPVPVHLREHFESEVCSLYEQGIIERSVSEYRSPVVLVRKSDNTYRMTVDYRNLNSVSKFDAEPSFNIEDDIHKFSGSNYFSDLDICKAYYQVELDAESRQYTAFPTSKGLMQFTRLPFGLSTACQTYARLMRIVLDGIANTTFYFDNILVFSKTWTEHLSTLEEVMDRLRLHGLTVKPNKCHFGFSSIQYLGHIISKDTISPLPDKVVALKHLNIPTSKKALRSFLGFLSFYRKFVPNLASIISPLNEMIKHKVTEPLVYDSEQSKSFHIAKDVLLSLPVLRLPELTKSFVVRSDSSGTGLGAVLLQYHDGVPFPVSYASRQLSNGERRFSTVERECLAIIFAVQRFSNFLIGRKFLLEVDHKPLVYLSKMRNMNSRLARWALCLQPFEYNIVHLPGISNVGADFLSRCDTLPC